MTRKRSTGRIPLIRLAPKLVQWPVGCDTAGSAFGTSAANWNAEDILTAGAVAIRRPQLRPWCGHDGHNKESVGDSRTTMSAVGSN
jgi:hypothetical protein